MLKSRVVLPGVATNKFELFVQSWRKLLSPVSSREMDLSFRTSTVEASIEDIESADSEIELFWCLRTNWEGYLQSKHSRLQSEHLGKPSSHFLFLFLHGAQPVCVLVIFTGFEETPASSQSTCSRLHRAHGISPEQACLIFAHLAQTVR